MSVTAAAGHPQLSGTFIPEVWSGLLNYKFYESTCLSQIANTRYEGEIKDQGDKVQIRQIPDITIRSYEKGQTLSYENPTAANIELEIDKGKYWAFNVDDVDRHQSDLSLIEDWSKDAAQQMKIEVETDVFADIYADPSSYNAGITAGKKSQDIDLGASGDDLVLTKSDILDKIVDMGVVLDEQDVPVDDRWLVMPAWACGMLKKSDIKDASMTGDGKSVLRNGRIGIIDRFTIYMSNLLTTATDGTTSRKATYMLFGQKSALTWASQITKTEKLRATSTFGDLVRGLNVYGYKVIKPEALGVLYASKG